MDYYRITVETKNNLMNVRGRIRRAEEEEQDTKELRDENIKYMKDFHTMLDSCDMEDLIDVIKTLIGNVLTKMRVKTKENEHTDNLGHAR